MRETTGRMFSKKLLIWAFMVAACGVPVLGAADSEDYFQQFVHYTIDVRLDPDKHMLTGSETIFYRNNSPDTLSQFYLHLYPNGYRSKESALIQDFSRGFNKTFFDLPEKHRSYLNILDVEIEGKPVTPEIDDTIARMELPQALLPGDAIEITLRFEEKVRRHIGRAGYQGKHYDVAQWYPKVVVYDHEGFHPDKFRLGEFYGEFGTFDVRIELPEDYVVAATGVLKEGDPGWTKNAVDAKEKKNTNKKGASTFKTVHFHAENVHDFAWCADPTFVVQDTTVLGVEIRSFYRQNNPAWRDSSLAHGVRAIEWLTEKIGAYSYPQVSIVDALLGGGMEYPMLVMDGPVRESLVLHEVGHIYFFGILGNDEREEAWLDEGFTSFQTSWYNIDRYGEFGPTKDWNWYQRLTPQFTELQQIRNRVFPLVRNKYGERISTRAEDFQHDYYTMVYRKASLMYFALRYVVGEETFDKILKTYFDKWKLKHVNEERFQQVCEEVSGQDLGWFFEQWLHTTKSCDYRLSKMNTTASSGGSGYTTNVTIERLGEVIMPLDLVFSFRDGSKQETRVEGRLRTIKQNFDFPEAPVTVALNPANEIADINLSDNFIPRKRSYQLDWPNNDFFPEDAYQIRYRPEAWYNDIDGLKAGLHLDGNYANRFKNLNLGLYYGFESKRLDFTASYDRPMRFLNKSTTFTLSGYKMEGRRDVTVQLDFRIRPSLMRPPTQRYQVGINFHELANNGYVANPETYQGDPDLAGFISYSVNPQFDVMSTVFGIRLRLGREWFGANYDYTSLQTSGVAKSRAQLVPFDLRLRYFLGVVSGSMPLQQKIQLAGGGPLAEERRFFLRSPGAIWDEANYHEPGGGNLRGYREGSFGVNRLAAVNFELGHSVPLLSKSADKLFGTIKVYGFTDVGSSFDSSNPIGSSSRVQALADAGILEQALVDAGVGFTLHRTLPFYDLFVRFDIPFYVNHPEINGELDKTKYRYVLSLSASF